MYNLLKVCPLFQHLSIEEYNLLMKNVKCRTLTFSKGQYIENFNSEIGIVLKGKIEVQKNLLAGKKIIMNKLKAGNIFGIAYIFHDNPNNVTSLLAVNEATIFFIKENDLFRLFQADHILLKKYLYYVSQRIYFLNQRVECFTHEKIRDRVIEFVEQLKVQQNNQTQVKLLLTKCELADYLGISRPSLYRILKELEEEKYFKIQGINILF
ncbi:Crp/Fnr family transcriptional regulator [Alkaliphilus peptidifermentans]|uniref:cAMP-binding domain of CRP or a regulatory subunit of cAMP-dependent protein kinases n=1 Tax=Alkaliphilus peptidifermentans DSM 18978 TaxID=1120976 RepID=A0A1G5IIT5_9FIRM|nr:Crp/Fnr family transcriptional regulator [Alkaliphilus peptidifermentans]SCY75897.1 cAMP-binding domain of CRP or a regulatory subunit of cAMP-dependent protein kinases [Alkaliphilus peptidifermentans DSM 18978]